MPEQPIAVVAVDAGGTSTRAVVVRLPGQCLGYAVAGSGNPIAVGPQAAAASVAESVIGALSTAEVPGTRIRMVVLAMAGAGSTDVAPEISSRLAGIGLDAPLVFESDLLATYFSGTHRPEGYAVIAGTGAGAIRVEDGRQVAVADGLGWLLGDEGSGFWIGRRVVRAALADLDGRGPSTALTPLMLDRLGVPAPSEPGDREPIRAAVRALYAGPPVRLADYAGLAFEADGDGAAELILDDAAAALARSLAAVRSPGVSGPVVLGGGILGRSPQVADRLAAACRAEEVRAVADGAVGACVLAVRHAGTLVDAAVFQQLTASLTAVR
ncbi:MAG TPA: BadF/BadG/BcrA/BcrD ATPase family protein [Nocardioides sp.]|uniref:N-acetylglucosamine kinase n=1 Tax=Nocardioides sp. TaxID=35761 RepID=UPI002F411313